MSMRVVALAALLTLLVPAADAKLPPPPTETAVVSKAPCGLAVAGGNLLVGVYETGQLLWLDRTGGSSTRATSRDSAASPPPPTSS